MAITFDQAIAVTTEPAMIVGYVITWLVPMIIYIIVGSIVRGRSASGKVVSEPMITANPNFFIPLIIWGFGGLILFLAFVVFPIPIWVMDFLKG